MDVSSLVEIKKNPRIPEIAPGDTVKVSTKILESGKERIQTFQGVVIKVNHGGNGASFTVRHVSFGIGVERTFPMHSPLLEKVEIVRRGKVRRARLFYLRGLSGREARRKIKRVEKKVGQVAEELLQPQPEEATEAAAAKPAAQPETVMTADQAVKPEASAATQEAAKGEKEPLAEKPGNP